MKYVTLLGLLLVGCASSQPRTLVTVRKDHHTIATIPGEDVESTGVDGTVRGRGRSGNSFTVAGDSVIIEFAP